MNNTSTFNVLISTQHKKTFDTNTEFHVNIDDEFFNIPSDEIISFIV